MAHCLEKLRVPVWLSHPTLGPRVGCLFLPPVSGRQDGHGSLLERFNSPGDVTPFVPSDGDRVLVVSRAHLDWVALREDVDDRRIYPDGYVPDREQQVELFFVEGGRLLAVVRWQGSREDEGVGDFLNASGRFVTARSAFGTLFVNTGRIREALICGPVRPHLAERGVAQKASSLEGSEAAGPQLAPRRSAGQPGMRDDPREESAGGG